MIVIALAVAIAAAPELVVPSNHGATIEGIAFSPSGALLASLSDDALVIWDVETRRVMRRFPVGGLTRSVVFVGDGAVAVSTLKAVTVFDIERGAARVSAAHDRLMHLTASSDGRVLIGAGYMGALTFLDPATLKATARVQLGDPRDESGTHILDVPALSPDGRLLAVPQRDDSISVIDVKKKRRVKHLKAVAAMSVAFSVDGRRLYASKDGTVVFDTATWARAADTAESGWLARASPDGRSLSLSTFTHSRAAILDAATLSVRARIACDDEIDAAGTHALAWSPRGDLVVCSGSRHRALRAFSTATWQPVTPFFVEAAPVALLSIGPRAGVAVTSDGPRLTAWPLGEHRRAAPLAPTRSAARKIAVRFGATDDEVRVWREDALARFDTRTGALVDEVDVRARGLPVLATVDERGPFAVVAGRSGGTCTIARVAVATWQQAWSRVVPDCPAHIAMSADGAHALLVFDYVVERWSLDAGERVASLLSSRPGDGRFSLHARGATSGVIIRDGELSVIDIATGHVRRTLRHSNFFTGAALSADESVVAAARREDAGFAPAMLELVHVDTGAPRGAVATDSTTLRALTLLERSRVVALRQDGTVGVFEVPGPGAKGTATTSIATLRLVSHERGEWVAASIDGRYDGTAAAMGTLHFLDGRRLLSLEALADRGHTPGLLAALVAGQPLRGPLTVRPPPRVAVHAEAAENSARVTVTVTDDGGGVSDVRLFHNGKRLAGEARGFRTASSTAKRTGAEHVFDVALTTGDNVFVAVAASEDGTLSPEATTTLTHRGATASATLWIVAVGINDYVNPRYALGFGRPDAEALVAALERRGQALFARVEKRLLVDRAATRASIESALSDVEAHAAPADVVVVFFAGHGAMSEGGGGSPEFFFAPADIRQLYGDDAGLASTALSTTRLREALARIPAQKQLMLLDACESGGAVDAFTARGAAEERALAQLARSAGVVVLSATQSAQAASELSALGHGVFTFAVLAALEGQGDLNRDGKVTVKELDAYLNDAVPALTLKHHGRAQFPMSFARGQDFPIATPSTP